MKIRVFSGVILAGFCLSFTMGESAHLHASDSREAPIKEVLPGSSPYITTAAFSDAERELFATAADSFMDLGEVERARVAKDILEKLAVSYPKEALYLSIRAKGGTKILYAQLNPASNAIVVNQEGCKPYIWSVRPSSPQVTNAVEAAPQPCTVCGEIIGADAPESPLSRDRDFKCFGMFQVCNDCLVKSFRDNKDDLAGALQVVLDHKWESIRHNLAIRE